MAEVFVPLNRFRSVIATLSNEADEVYVTPTGISTIILSSQITNNTDETKYVSILVDSNRNLSIPNFSGIEMTGSFTQASELLELNRNFIQSEALAYVVFQNNLLETPIQLNLPFLSENYLREVDAISYDIENNTTIRTKKAADKYYDKDGNLLLVQNQISASISGIDYASKLAEMVLQNRPVTESANIPRLFQNGVTQSFNLGLIAESGSIQLVENLYNVIIQNIINPIREPQPIVELISKNPIPKYDSLSPVISGRLVLEEGYSLILTGSENLSVVLSLLESANE